VILAAGKSERFGRNKLLERIDGETMVERVVKRALASRARPVVVVLGHEAEKVRNVLRGLECRIVVNEEFEKGQSSSVRRGVSEVAAVSRAVAILPGDITFIRTESIDRVIEAYEREGARIVIASHGGRAGHPILFDGSLFEELLSIGEETMGLRAVVSRHRGEVYFAEVPTEDVLVDVDAPEDLLKYRYLLGKSL